jgi:hypothetical protein
MVRAQQRQTEATPEQLRADIDSGRTHDKIAHPDPAAAPLGTDEEAAGTRIDPHAVSGDRRAENRAVPEAPDRAKAHAQSRKSRVLMIVLCGVVCAILVMLYWLLVPHRSPSRVFLPAADTLDNGTGSTAVFASLAIDDAAPLAWRTNILTSSRSAELGLVARPRNSVQSCSPFAIGVSEEQAVPASRSTGRSRIAT